MAKVNELFNPKTIKRLCSSVKISTAQKKASAEWLKLLESGQLEKEKQNYFKFALIILKDLLGYQVKEEMGYEEGNVEFTFADQKGKKIICFEAKGTKTKDLFAPQFREKKEHSTPIKQTWDYMGTLNLDYGVATNYGQFVLIDKSKGTSKYHIFNYKDVKNNEDKLKEFIAIFSKESIIDKKFVVTLYDQSFIEEKEFTKQENLRQALKLPPIREMSAEQIRQFDNILQQFQTGDEFFSVRKLETVDNTDLKGIKTIREARERLAKEMGVEVSELENIKVTEFDRFRFDTALAEKNNFYKLLVDTTNENLLNAEARYLKVEKEIKVQNAKNKTLDIGEKLTEQQQSINALTLIMQKRIRDGEFGDDEDIKLLEKQKTL